MRRPNACLPMHRIVAALRPHPLHTLVAGTVFLFAPSLATAQGQGAAPPSTSASSARWNPQEILRTETFVKPPVAVERMIMAPRTDLSFTLPNPDRAWFLRTSGADRGDIIAYGKPHIYLAGLQVDTKANRARALTTSTRRGLSLVNPHTGATRTIRTPAGATISAPVWSPAGTQVAFIANFDHASFAYVADAASGQSTRVSPAPLLATLATTLTYSANGRQLFVVLVPETRGPAPVRGTNGVADGPQVRLTNARAIPQPVHASLLEDPFDKAQLRYYTTGQLAALEVNGKGLRRIGAPRMIRTVEPSANGMYLIVTSMTEPFSYLVPITAFGSVQELWDASGKVVTTLSSLPLREVAPGDGGDASAAGRGAAAADTGKRNITWNPVGPGLVYFESVFPTRAGSGTRLPPSRVRYMHWLPPFSPNDTGTVFQGGAQFNAVSYSADRSTMFVSDSGVVMAMRTADVTKRFTLPPGISLASASGPGVGARAAATDSASAGGQLVTTRGVNGQSYTVLGSDGKSVVVSGTRMPGAEWSRVAPRPWVDRLDIETGARTRVFESPADSYEEFVTALDDNVTKYIYTRESPTVIADAFVRDVATGTTKQLTHNVDVGPEVTGAITKRLHVARARDGAKIWVDVTMPRDWTPGTKLPGILWFYPREYASSAEYERSRYATNINRFPEVPALRPASATKIWVSQGYALIEPDIPIFGDSGRMNDNYTRDLKENLDAVLDAVVDAGYVDRDRMGIGGHSYGAFSTVNAMTLVPYFRAGIAGDGMYNRSLTPFGFQSERRNFYQAQGMYFDMSPFLRADKIAGALLMYHATEDQNQGTAPLSSIRMMAALQGLGKPAALYLYPYEDHSVATYASDLDLWARWFAWFDVYVKGTKSAMPPIVP